MTPPRDGAVPFADVPFADVEVVGFDLGHGDSALAVTRVSATAEPKPVEIGNREVIRTVVGLRPDGAIAIGHMIRAGSDIVEFDIRFKSARLDDDPRAGLALRRFVAGVTEQIRAGHKLADPDAAVFFVGCPSGWPERGRAEPYRALLEGAGLARVRVVPESRGALMHARDTGRLNPEELRGRVLLIDVGSSTTDFTLSVNLRETPVDFGLGDLPDIGAGLLDDLILEQAIAESGEPDAVRRALADSPTKRAEIEDKVRAVKHRYFDALAGSGEEEAQLVRLGAGLVEITLSDRIMDRLLDRPVPALGGLPLRRAFRERLAAARARIGEAPAFVILTGAAARMGFVRREVEAAFPAPASRLVEGSEPELAVAKGLAMFGRARLRQEAFAADVQALVRGDGVEALVAGALPDLRRAVGLAVGGRLVDDVVIPELRAWRDRGTGSLEAMEAAIRARVQHYGRPDSPDGAGRRALETAVSLAVRGWFDGVRPALHALTDPICARHGVQPSTLEIALDMDLSEDFDAARVLPDVIGDVDTLLDLIVGSVMVALTLKIGGILAVTGVGWIPLAIAGLGGFFAGQEFRDRMVSELKRLSIPFGRGLMLRDAKIERLRADAVAAIAGAVAEALKADAAGGTAAIAESRGRPASGTEARGALGDRIAQQIEGALLRSADDALLRFS